MAKAITYVEIGQNGSLHSTFYSATDSVIDDAWTELAASMSFTDTDGNTVLVRGARRWDTPRMKGTTCLGNIGGATFDAQLGNMETQPTRPYSDLVDLDTDAFRTKIVLEDIDREISEVAEPVAADAQVTYTLTSADIPPGAAGITLAPRGVFSATGKNDTGGDILITVQLVLNGEDVYSPQSQLVSDGNTAIISGRFGAQLNIGDVLGFKIYGDAPGFVVHHVMLLITPYEIAATDGMIQMSGFAEVYAGIDGVIEGGSEDTIAGDADLFATYNEGSSEVWSAATTPASAWKGQRLRLVSNRANDELEVVEYGADLTIFSATIPAKALILRFQ